MSGPVESRRGTNSPGLLPSPSPQTGASEATIPYCPPRTMTKTTRRSKLSHHLSVPAEFGTPELVSTRRASADAISPLSLSASKLQRTGSERMWQDIRMGPELSLPMTPRSRFCKSISRTNSTIAKAKARNALKINDAMVYLEGPQVYACAQCRTHLTSHDDIISKSFHGRHGRAYLFDQCVNITLGPAEDRNLMTGLHSVCDIFCKRCKNMVGWTYAKAYESSQKYKEGKYIIEKINLHLEESGRFDVAVPAGERVDRWRQRSLSWGDRKDEVEVFEYDGSPQSPTFWRHSSSDGASWGSGSSSCGLGMIASPVGIPSAPVL